MAMPDTPLGTGHIRAGLRRALAACADLTVPPCCVVCRARIGAHHLLFATCWREVNFIRPPLCDVLGIPLPFDTGERTVSAGALAHPRPTTVRERLRTTAAPCAPWCTS
jgi:predicted amidophosphoribosyltransferase